jgi:hypothetical protein
MLQSPAGTARAVSFPPWPTAGSRDSGVRTETHPRFILQEVKKACYLAGRVPAARTGLDNVASGATLQKAGLRVSGFMLFGFVRVP